jgi:hypothetical protein
VRETFTDVENLATYYRFSHCNHESEPECKLRKAIESGEQPGRRCTNYQKLLREQEALCVHHIGLIYFNLLSILLLLQTMILSKAVYILILTEYWP